MKPKTKRKAVRLYALMVGAGEGLQIIDWARSSGVLLAGPGAKVVELVERDRHAERVLKLVGLVAKEWRQEQMVSTLVIEMLIAAYEKARHR